MNPALLLVLGLVINVAYCATMIGQNIRERRYLSMLAGLGAIGGGGLVLYWAIAILSANI